MVFWNWDIEYNDPDFEVPFQLFSLLSFVPFAGQNTNQVNYIDRSQIMGFHVCSEEILPFEDGNGRVGRLIMFKKCPRHGTMLFIIDDKR